MYYLVVHVIVEIAHVIFQTTVKFQLIVDCSATYFIFMNSLFQGIVVTPINFFDFPAYPNTFFSKTKKNQIF